MLNISDRAYIYVRIVERERERERERLCMCVWMSEVIDESITT